MASCTESKQEDQVIPTSEDTDEHHAFSLLAFREKTETEKAIAELRIWDYGRYHFVFLFYLDWLGVTFGKRRKRMILLTFLAWRIGH